MAGAGAKLFTSGSVLTADQVNTFLMDQSIMRFTSTTTRDAAFGGAGEPTLSEGMFAYTTDTDTLWYYTGSVWQAVLGSNIGTISTSNRNKIINGAFDINQRAFTSVTTNSYGFDRFSLFAVDGTNTYSAQTFTAGAAPVAGYEGTNFARIVSTGQTATTALTSLQQSIEDVRTFAGQTVTVSFWAKAGSGTPSIVPWFQQSFGSGGSTAVNTGGTKQAITTSWARYSFTIAIPSVSGKTIGSANILILRLVTSAGTDRSAYTDSIGIQSATIDFWGIQVEAGSVATPFETEDIGTTLAKCQRYYFRSVAGNPQQFGTGLAYSTTGIYVNIPFPVTMRSAPTSLETTGTASNYAVTLSSTASQALTSIPTFNAASVNSAGLLAVSTTGNLVQGNATFLVANTTNIYLGFSAEL